MSDGHYDAPAYCNLCDRPIAIGPLCDDCANQAAMDGADLDGWGGMSWEERTKFATLNIDNGNYTDAINFIMHDGDVRVDSVELMLRVVECQVLDELDLTTDYTTAVTDTINRLIRNINTWETT